jgi:type II secretory pathway predicted ATPase ExeA
MQQHAPLAMRVAAQVHLEPLGREAFAALVEHGLKAAGATSKLLSDPAIEMLFRASRGVPRVAAKMLRAALRLAHESDQSFVDDRLMAAAGDELSLTPGVS